MMNSLVYHPPSGLVAPNLHEASGLHSIAVRARNDA